MNDHSLISREKVLMPRPASSDDSMPGQSRTDLISIGSAQRSHVSSFLIVVFILSFVLAVYWQTTLSMVSIWARSETFAHGFVIIPIFIYLLWRRREELAANDRKPFWPALAGIAVAGFCWLVGTLVNAAVISQLAMVAMVPLAVWMVLGTRVARSIAIPLAFLFFAVPFGEFLLPTLMDWTADFTVSALRASGVPVYREGNFFTIPSGSWSVVEACGGLRYLIASLMVGCLYAYLSYRSTIRRVVFIAASIAVPIVANWLRAYMIVMLGHLSGNRLAVGVDHLIYGWIFFGLVIALLLWIGSRWREDEEPADLDRSSMVMFGDTRKHIWVAAAFAFVGATVWQPLEAHFGRGKVMVDARLQPIAGRDGWMDVGESVADWRPHLSGTRAELRQTFAKDGHRVGLYIAYYSGQTTDAKAITSMQLVRLAGSNGDQIIASATPIDAEGSAINVRAGVVLRPRQRLAFWQWYWVDGRITSNDFVAKLYEAVSVLKGHGDAAGWVVIYAPTDGDEPKVRSALASFASAMRESIDAVLAEAAMR